MTKSNNKKHTNLQQKMYNGDKITQKMQIDTKRC